MATELYRARCVRECTWRGKRWYEGDIYVGPEEPPEWFEAVDGDDDGDDEGRRCFLGLYRDEDGDLCEMDLDEDEAEEEDEQE